MRIVTGVLLAVAVLVAAIDGAAGQDAQAPEDKPLAGKTILMVIAPDGFRDEELLVPQRVLQDRGARVVVASRTTETCKGMLGAEVTPDIALDQVQGADYAAVVFVGGSGAKTYFEDAKARGLARAAWKADRVVAAICIAPGILAREGLLKGRAATAWKSEQATLREHGARVLDVPVVRDERLVTANGPQAAEQFGRAITEALTPDEDEEAEPEVE